jgi:dienelactone hydrolase
MQLAEYEKRWAIIAFAAIIWVPLVLLIAKLSWDAAFYIGYDPTLPLAAQVETTQATADYQRYTVRFQGTRGTMVPAVVVTPRGDGPWPTVVFLHGIGQDKGYLDEIAGPFVDAGFVIASFDQYGQGERSRPRGPVAQALALRRRSALTVIETRRLIDFLQALPYVDATQVYLLGASYGAMTGATAAAMDPRLRAAVLVYGGGDLATLFDSPAAREATGALYLPGRWLLMCLLAPADPERHIGGISPRPLLMFAGTRDSMVPPASAQALYTAAGEPKEIVWLESEHIGEDSALVRVVISRTIRFLEAMPTAAPQAHEDASKAQKVLK